MARAILAAASLCALALLAPPLARAQSFTLALGGDVIFDSPIERALRERRASSEDPASYEPLLRALRPSLEAAELAIVNLETPVGPRRQSRDAAHDVPIFAAPPAFLVALARAGVDVVTLANNHAYDQGVEGLATTRAEVARAGLVAAGIEEEPGFALVRAGGLRVAVVSFTQGTNLRPTHGEAPSPRVATLDPERLRARIERARAEADVVLVALHFTDTGDRMPSRGMRAWARRAAEAGADLVIGHGPHVPASSEWIDAGGRRVLALHSLGNLLATMRAERHAERSARPHVRDSVVVTLRVTRRGGRTDVALERIATHWIGARRGTHPDRPFTLPIATDPLADDELGRRAQRLVALLSPDAEAAPPLATAASARTATPEARAGDARRAPSTEPRPAASASALGARFRCGSATEASADASALRGWVERMRAAPRAQLVVTSTRCPGESAALAARRARRASGLVAVLGPSRSRIRFEVGEEREGEPLVMGRLE